MEPVILGNEHAAWLALGTGLVLLAVGSVAHVLKKLELRVRIGLIATGSIALILAPLLTRSRIELHPDKIVQHIQVLGADRKEISLDGITRVTIAPVEDGDSKNDVWVFHTGGERKETFVPAAIWRRHSDRIREHLLERGIAVE